MKNVKKIISCFCALTVIAGVVFPNAVFADTKSDATASIQFTNANRLKLRTSLNATNLSPKDVMATNYVLEDFNEWSTDRATMAGATYSDYSGGWEARAKAKIGGTRASANGISLPVTGLGTYGQFGGGNQFLVNLLKITSTSSSSQATVGWFGSTTDGYYGFKNTGGAKKIIDTTPSVKITSTVSETETPVYTSTTDSLLYVGDTDGDNENGINDWMNFQGQIVVSYDWLVSPVSTVTKEIMTLDNIAVHYSRTNKEGTSKETQNVGDFPITGLPIVYYDTASSSVKMRSHAGIDFSKNNPNYDPDKTESDPKRLLPWKLANDKKYFNTLDISGINKGDWVNLTVVLDVQGTNSSNRVISQREFLNGELVKNANGESVCTIKPYDTEYIISTTSSKPGAPESCSLEGYPYSGKWADWAPAEYYGIGVSFSNGSASDDWGGIDNLCYRVYNGTKLDKTEYSGSDISNGNLEIGFSTNTGLTSSQLSVAPKIATSGIVDMGNDADIKIVKTNVANDPLILAGQETSASVTKLNNIDMTNYTYPHQGTVTGKKYLDGTAVRISGLDNLSGDDAYVVSIDTKDATEKPFRENVICTDSQNVGFIGTTLLDFLGNDVTSEASLISAGQYSIPCNANEFVLYSTDETAQTVTIEGNGNTYNATFLNGKYTVSLDSLLSQNTQYLIKKNGTEVASFVPSEGGFTYEAYKNSSGKPAIRYANATNDSISGFLIAYNSQTDLKAMGVSIPAGGFGEQSMTVSDNYDNVLFVKSLKLGNNESERNSDKADMTPFVSASSTLSGNLTEKDKDVMLVVIKGDSWANDTEISNSIVYIDFDITKDEPPVTVDGTSHKKGDYEFDITFPAGFTTGKYTFMVYSDDSAYKRVVAYGKDTDNLSAIETFKTSPQTAIGSETTRDSLEFYYDEVEKKYQPAELSAFYNSVATILANELAINPLPAEQGAAKAKAIELYRQAAIAKGVADGKVTDLDKVSDDISILSSGVLSGYWKGNTGVKDSKKSTWKTDVTSRLAGKTFETVSTPLVAPVSSETATSFEKALTEAVILQVVEDAESVDAAKNVMQNTFAGLNTLTQSTVTSYTAGTVMNQYFATFDALQSALTVASQAGVAPPPVNNDNPGNRGGNLGNVGVESDSKKPQETEKESEPEQEEKYSFSDMASAPWADEAVKTLKEMGVVNGKTETEFAPSDNVTREEFVKMIVLLADINVEHGDVEFSDVKESDWYYKSIKAAAQKNIINGISEKEFGVGRKITRQDMAVITANVLSYLNISVSKKNLEFSDAELISDYAKDAISKLTAKGIINGYDDNTFKPNGFATRAEAAKILYGILPLLK